MLHPNIRYEDDLFYNDIALIKLKEASSITPVRLATPSDENTISTGATVTVAGWGTTSKHTLELPNQLNAVELLVSDYSVCNTAYNNNLNYGHICARGRAPEEQDACAGDSGGPLMARTAAGPIQVGIVSYGEGCALNDFPGVYTHIAAYNKFIQNVINVVAPDAGGDLSIVFSDSDGLGHVPVGEQGSVSVMLRNPSRRDIAISDVSLSNTSNTNIAIDQQNCTATVLIADATCSISISWKPSDETVITETLSLGVSYGGAVQTLSVTINGISQSLNSLGDAVGVPNAEFTSNHNRPWVISTHNPKTGFEAIESLFSADDVFELTSLLNASTDSALTFSYMLRGATGSILVEDSVVAPLSSNSAWETIRIAAPKGSHIKWRIEASELNCIIRLDNFNMVPSDLAQDGIEDGLVNDDPYGNSGSSIVVGGPIVVGSVNLLSLLVLLGVAGMRRRPTLE